MKIKTDRLPYEVARWVEGDDFDADAFDRDDTRCLLDRDDNYVVLFRSPWALRWAEEQTEGVRFRTTAPIKPDSPRKLASR